VVGEEEGRSNVATGGGVASGMRGAADERTCEGSAAGAAEGPKKARASPNGDTPLARLVVLGPDDRRTTPQDGARGKPTIKGNAAR
jgi:hypothetical protein